MNIINVKVNFTRGTCETTGINLITGDYNSTKMVFQFDREDGTKIFEMKSPSEQLAMVQEIINNEVELYGMKDVTTTHNNKTYTKYTKENATYWYQPTDDKLFDDTWAEVVTFDLDEYELVQEIASIFTEDGSYIFEISLYENGSKLTSASGKIKVKPEQVVIDDEVVEAYIPVFDQLLNDITTTVQGLEDDVDDKLDEVDAKLDDVDGKLLEVDNKLDDVDDKIAEVDDKIETIEGQIETAEEIVDQANNLDLDISKVGKTTTVTITKKDETTESENILDGKNLEFVWSGTSLGVRVEGDSEYTYVNLQGIQGPVGPQGEPFKIKKTYSSISEMNADYNNMNIGDYVMIANSVETEDNAKLYTKTAQTWVFITDFSGATGIQGPTGPAPSISIGTVTSGSTSSVTRTGTDENPVFNFVLEKGDKGDTGDTGATGETGNGISNIQKTSTSGLVDTYTITYTDGTTQTYEVTNGEDGEVTQAQLDEVIAENDYLNSIIDQIVPKTTATGTSITLDDTLQAKMNMELNPSELEQETTTGKNKMPFTNQDFTLNNVRYYVQNGSLYINGTSTGETSSKNQKFIDNFSFTLPSGTYTVSQKSTVGLYLFDSDGNNIFSNPSYVASNTSRTFTLTEETSLFFGLYVFQQSFANINTEIMISTTGGDYEPYTYGASPNPQYLQEIHTISGNNTIKVVGKNLAKETFDSKFSITGSGQERTIVSSNSFTAQIIKVKSNTTYTCSGDFSVFGESVIRIVMFDNLPTIGSISTKFVYSGTEFTFTTDTNTQYIMLYNNIDRDTISLNLFVCETQYADTYEPYQEQTAQLNLPVENLFNINGTYSNTACSIVVSNDELTQTNTGAYSRSVWAIENLIIGQAYTLSLNYINTNSSSIEAMIRNSEDNTTIANSEVITSTSGNIVLSFNATETTHKIRLYSNATTTSNSSIVKFSNILLEKGTNKNSYSPYGATPLEYSKIGNYADVFMKPSGNQLWDEEWELGDIKTADGSDLASTTRIRTKNYIPVLPNTTYYITAPNNINIFEYNENKVKQNNVYGHDFTITTTSTTAYLRMEFTNTYGTTYKNDIMLNLGSTALPYEPYGTKWYLKKNIGKVVLSSKTWETRDWGFTAGIIDDVLAPANNNTSANILCSCFTKATANQVYNLVGPAIENGIAIAQNKSLIARNTSSTTLQAFENVINNQPLYYQLATPTYTKITGTLANQLENIYQKLLSYKGQTNISQINNDLPFIMTSTALKEL